MQRNESLRESENPRATDARCKRNGPRIGIVTLALIPFDEDSKIFAVD